MSTAMPLKARIREGAKVGQDHGIGELSEDMAGKLFDVHPFSETRVRLTAWGYGETGKGSYGNGALYVAKEDVIPMEEERNPYEKGAEIKIKACPPSEGAAPEELAEEVYRAYAYFMSRELRVGVRSGVATSSEADRMFQAWLALKLASLKDRPMLPPFPYDPVSSTRYVHPPRGDAQGPE